jgi:CheY-like chemotaxis protein
MPQAPHVPALNPDTLSDILHELRNPLSTVAAHAETLVEGIYGPLSSGQSGALHSMRQQLAHALLLLDDLAKIWLPDDTESTTAGETESDPVALCRQALDQSAAVIASRDLKLNNTFPQTPFTLAIPSHVFESLMRELLACGFLLVPKNSRLRLAIIPSESGTFIGFLDASSVAQSPVPDLSSDSALLKSALVQLQRVKPIGLHLLKRWISQLGGTLVANATSTGNPALGILLPFSNTTNPRFTEQSALPHSFSDDSNETPLILIADDQETLAAVVKNYLEDLGFRVLLAVDGHEAVRLACSDKPGIVIMDVRMPLLDGLQAMMKIRASNDPAIADIPIVCVSGSGSPGEQERCINAGATAFLPKPFGVQELLKLIARFFPNKLDTPPPR